jgi:hypothetical protein
MERWSVEASSISGSDCTRRKLSLLCKIKRKGKIIPVLY